MVWENGGLTEPGHQALAPSLPVSIRKSASRGIGRFYTSVNVLFSGKPLDSDVFSILDTAQHGGRGVLFNSAFQAEGESNCLERCLRLARLLLGVP